MIPKPFQTAVALCAATAVFSCRAIASSRHRVIAPEQGEAHLTNIRQLTFGGENAEAYFSADGKRLTFQGKSGGQLCDQQYVMNVDGSNVHRISNGQGKTTCGYF